MQPFGHARARPVGLQVVEHRGRPAAPRLPIAPVGHEVVEIGGCELAVAVGVPLDQAQPALGVEPAQLGPEDDVVRRRRGVHDHDVVELVQVRPEHPHHRGDAGAGRDEEGLAAMGAEDEVAGGLVELEQRAGRSRRTT